MEYKEGLSYKTRDDILITILKVTPHCKYKAVGYFQLRQTRIRVFYDDKGNEFFGERGLDLMRMCPIPGPYNIKSPNYKEKLELLKTVDTKIREGILAPSRSIP